MKKLSVLLPVYNAGLYLDETLHSLRHQRRQPDQIVIVDDGSNDQSPAILEKHRLLNSRIELISQDNNGVSSARNRGLAACEGEYIALMDADDICQPQRFEIQLEAMERKRLDLCGSWISTFGRSKRTIKYPVSDAEIRFNYLFLSKTIANPSAMIRRSAIGNLRYDEQLVFAEDFGFFLSLLLSNPALRMENIPEVLLRYRTHTAQASQRHAKKNESSLKPLLFKQFNEHGLRASKQQIDTHYQIWQGKKSISFEQLQSYVPLMQQLIEWLEQAPNTKRLSAQQWSTLAKLQRHLGKDGAELIKSTSGQPWTLWQRLLQLFL